LRWCPLNGARAGENSPFGLRHSICGRSASLRMVPEKIFIRAQSPLFSVI
jgi:hypothetical protein